MDELSAKEFEKKCDEAMDSGRKVVIMFEDVDGNWRGVTKKGELFLQARQVGPETVLQMLLTHDGK